MTVHEPPPAAAHEPEAGKVSLRWRLLPLGLVALVAGVAAVGWLSRGAGGAGPTRAQRLAEVAGELAARAPGGWRGIVPIPPGDLASAQPPTGEGLRVVAPRGGVFDTRPRTRWSGVPIEARVEVRLLHGPVQLWSTTGQGRFLDFPSDAPALVPGRYVVTMRGAPDALHVEAAFEVMGDAERGRWAEVRAAAAAHAPADLRTLLEAHAAARLGYLLEAERLAQEALRHDARNDDALALLRWVHAQLGESEGYERGR